MMVNTRRQPILRANAKQCMIILKFIVLIKKLEKGWSCKRRTRKNVLSLCH